MQDSCVGFTSRGLFSCLAGVGGDDGSGGGEGGGDWNGSYGFCGKKLGTVSATVVLVKEMPLVVMMVVVVVLVKEIIWYSISLQLVNINFLW